MSHVQPSAADIATAIAIASRAPSVVSLRPWRWQVTEGGLELHAQRALTSAYSDSEVRSLMVSCGATLHHVCIAMAATGWRACVNRLTDKASPTKLVLLTFEQARPSVETLELANAIGYRRPDRRPTGTGELPVGCASRFAKLASRSATSTCRDIDRDSPPLPLLLTTATDDRVARLRAGEALSIIVLDATRLGLAATAHPARSVAGTSLSREHPQAMLMIGWPSRADPLPATPSARHRTPRQGEAER